MAGKMAEIRSNAKEFLKRLDKCNLERHHDIMMAFADNLDDIRFKAVERYMYPKAPRKVKARPDKLTIRSGKLANIMRHQGQWNVPRSLAEARLKAGQNLLFWIRPQIKSDRAEYMARLSVVEAGDAGVKYRVNHEARGDRRGVRRPFLAPAINDNRPRFLDMMARANARTLIP